MHDPLTVAFEIPSPFLRRSPLRLADGPRWGVVVWRRTNPENLGERVYPWWRPAGYELRLAGSRYRCRTLVTVWHREPGGRDSGEVCKHYRRVSGPDDSATVTVLHGWRWHVHHWHVQVRPLQELRRTLLTRCEWCGGRSTRASRVNVSHQWDRAPGPWWRGARGLFHRHCSSAAKAANACTCEDPMLPPCGYGTCAWCGLQRGHVATDVVVAQQRLWKTVPSGMRPGADLIARAEALYRTAKGVTR